jgi:hypothetical protein
MKTAIKIYLKGQFIPMALISACLFFWGCSSDDPTPMEPADTFGAVAGTVLAGDGSAYANVRVTLLANGNTIQKSNETDASGNYQISQVPVGNYTLIVKAPLGSTVTGNDAAVTISDGQTTQKDFSFEINSINAVVVLSPNDPFSEIQNENGVVPTGNETIYTPFAVSDPDSGPPSAIMAPDGHHVTLNEWAAAEGTVTVSCDGSTTMYVFELTGLIPNGVYTLWNGIFKHHQEPNQNLSFATSFEGLGALKDGASNTFTASAQGEASLELSVDPGSLSMFGSQPPCAITAAEGFVLVVDYHIDQNTYGITPGPDHLEVAHLLFYL